MFITQNTDQKNDSKNNIKAACLSYREMEQLEKNWSDSNTVPLLLKKGFECKYKYRSKTATIYVFINQNRQDMLEISTEKSYYIGSSFTLNYYLKSKTDYTHFIKQLSDSEYKYNIGEKYYEKYMGTYEDKYISPNGQFSKNNRLFYVLKYVHYLGKELSSPI